CCEESRPELVDEHDLVAGRVVAEHGDRVAAFHHIADQGIDAAVVPFDLELVAVDIEEASVQGRHAIYRNAELTVGHTLPPRTHERGIAAIRKAMDVPRETGARAPRG